MTKTVVVLGSNSFSGAHFVALLLDAGYRVVGISRSEEPDPVFLAFKWTAHDGFAFHRLDINKDLDAIVGTIACEKPQYIVNFASQGMVAESWANPVDWFRTNTMSQVRLHDALRHFTFLEKYVHISTPEVYGSFSGAKSEDVDYRPTTPYAVSRAATDMSLAAFHRRYGFPVVFTRASNVYGPGQQLYRLIPRVMLSALTGMRMQLNNGGASRRSFIHIRDAMAATLAVMEGGKAGQVYHIATERLSSVREAAEIAAAALGVDLNDVADIGPGRPGRDAVYNLDSSKIRDELGWRDQISLTAGIDETAEWAKKNLDMLRTMPLAYEHKA